MRYTTWLKRWEKKEQWPKYVTTVGILWRDAAHSEDKSNAGTMLSWIVGTVIEATSKEIKVAMEVFEDLSDRDVTAIPTSLVQKVFVLFYAPLFKGTKR